MNKSIKFLLSFIAFTHLAINSFALNIYVSPTGNDSWSGKSITNSGTNGPVATLNRAFEIAIKSDGSLPQSEEISILMAGGTYICSKPIILRINDQSYFSHRITVKPYQINSIVTITGSIPVEQLDKYKTAYSNVKYDELFSNSSIINHAKFPANGFYTLVGFSNRKNGKSIKDDVQAFSFNPSELNNVISLNSIKKGSYGVLLYSQWTYCYKNIDSVDLRRNIFYTSGQNNSPFSAWAKGTRYKLIKLPPTLANTSVDDLKELFNIQSAQNIYIPINETFINAFGSASKKISNITFSNVKFKNWGYNYSNSNIEPNQSAFTEDASWKFSYTDGLIFDGCEFQNISKNAIWLMNANSSVKIVNCRFTNMGSGTIKVGNVGFQNNMAIQNKDIAIINNQILNSGSILPSANPIFIINGQNITVQNNNIKDAEYTAIAIGWGWGSIPNIVNNVIISKNKIENIGTGLLDDLGGIYTLGLMSNVTISNNIVRNLKFYHYGSWGIYIDQGSKNIVVTNNIVEKCQSAGFMQNRCQNITVTNNIFANNVGGQVQFGNYKDSVSLKFTNNVLYQNDGGKPSNINWNANLIHSDYNVYLNPAGTSSFAAAPRALMSSRVSRTMAMSSQVRQDKDSHSKYEQVSKTTNVMSTLNVSRSSNNFNQIDTTSVGYKHP